MHVATQREVILRLPGPARWPIWVLSLALFQQDAILWIDFYSLRPRRRLSRSIWVKAHKLGRAMEEAETALAHVLDPRHLLNDIAQK